MKWLWITMLVGVRQPFGCSSDIGKVREQEILERWQLERAEAECDQESTLREALAHDRVQEPLGNVHLSTQNICLMQGVNSRIPSRVVRRMDTKPRVYCDTGGFRKELSEIQRQGKLTLIMFPYENQTRLITSAGLPSEATFRDLESFVWENLPVAFEDYQGSALYDAIGSILHPHNRKDILHLDSAYKNHCACFLTRDKDDILANRTEIEELLGVRVFHPDEDWDDFVTFISSLYLRP